MSDASEAPLADRGPSDGRRRNPRLTVLLVLFGVGLVARIIGFPVLSSVTLIGAGIVTAVDAWRMFQRIRTGGERPPSHLVVLAAALPVLIIGTAVWVLLPPAGTYASGADTADAFRAAIRSGETEPPYGVAWAVADFRSFVPSLELVGAPRRIGCDQTEGVGGIAAAFYGRTPDVEECFSFAMSDGSVTTIGTGTPSGGWPGGWPPGGWQVTLIELPDDPQAPDPEDQMPNLPG